MKHRIISGAIAAMIIGIVMALAMHHDEINRGQLGREEFLAKQGVRYDKYFSKPDPIGGEMIQCMIATGVFVGAYELVALGISWTLRRLDPEGKG